MPTPRILDNVERITVPSRDEFFRNYVATRKPVLIQGLYAGQPISRIDSVEAARQMLGDMKLEVRGEYHKTTSDSTTPITLGGYLDWVEREPETSAMCIELETPARVLALFDLPEACRTPGAADHDVFTHLFVGHAGSVAHMHFDGDHRQVLLTEVLGRKRVTILPPIAAKKLLPCGNNATIAFECMSEGDKLKFVEYCGGWDTLLSPGETIFIPMLMWHHLEYVDPVSLGYNVRFGRNRFGRFLSVDTFPMDMYVQNIGALMVDEEAAAMRYADVFRRLQSALGQQAPDLVEKYRSVRALFKDLCREHCPEAVSPEYFYYPLDEREIRQFAEHPSGGLLLTDRGALDANAPQGPVPKLQKDRMLELMARHGYPPDVVRRIVQNRFCKASIDELTKPEGTRLLKFLGSTSAAWS